MEHYLRVSESFSDDDPCKLVALYHDVVESGYIELDDLKKVAGLTDEEAEAIDAITRRPGEQYMDYIKRLSSNPIAVKVKLADLKDNKVVVEEMVDTVGKAMQEYARRHKSFTVRMNVYTTGSPVRLTSDTTVNGRVVSKGSYVVYSTRIRDIELHPCDGSSESSQPEDRNPDVYSDVLKEYAAAKKKHPEFAEDLKHGLSIIMEELGELAKEINDADDGWKERAITEAAHVAVTAIRMIEKLKQE